MRRFLPLLACMLPFCETQANGHAEVGWIPENTEVADGAVARTVIRMNIDEGWHTYWENPGEVGTPITIKTNLPEGWAAGNIQYPPPHRLTVSELTSFCFEGELLLPLTLTPPTGFTGKLPELSATVSWLACDDQACVPGKQEVTLQSDPDSKLVSKGYDGLPRQLPGARLTISEDDTVVRMGLNLPADWKTDISGFSVFPVTRSIVAPGTDFKFTRTQGDVSGWAALAPKNEYYEKLPESFSILISDGSGKTWLISSESKSAIQPKG